MASMIDQNRTGPRTPGELGEPGAVGDRGHQADLDVPRPAVAQPQHGQPLGPDRPVAEGHGGERGRRHLGAAVPHPAFGDDLGQPEEDDEGDSHQERGHDQGQPRLVQEQDRVRRRGQQHPDRGAVPSAARSRLLRPGREKAVRNAVFKCPPRGPQGHGDEGDHCAHCLLGPRRWSPPCASGAAPAPSNPAARTGRARRSRTGRRTTG